ncbi:MAG TPA: acyl carrier protein [Trebonia sp.]|jgi:acyl carrier protein|nr:acyl carrier protein [Trebonia sp.]
MNDDSIRVAVGRIAGEMSPLGERPATCADRLVEDLGYDSLAMIELSQRLEEEFALTGADTSEALDVKTVADLLAFVERHR